MANKVPWFCTRNRLQPPAQSESRYAPHQRHLRHPRSGAPRRLRPALDRRRGASGRYAEHYVVTPPTGDLFRSGIESIRECPRNPLQQRRLSARQLRQRQEPFHGGADAAVARQSGGPLHSRAGAGRRQAQAWTQGRKFLVVPYHMIGATSLESAVLGHYADYIRTRHPEAPTPGFYQAERLFADARRLRKAMGDEAFFAQLGRDQEASGWGSLGSGWDANSFEAAMGRRPRRTSASAWSVIWSTPSFSRRGTWPHRERGLCVAGRGPVDHVEACAGAWL